MSRPTPLAGAYARRARGIVELLGWHLITTGYDSSRSRVRSCPDLAARR